MTPVHHNTARPMNKALAQLLSAPEYAVVALATVLSFVRTGYLPINNNNIYHIPILKASFDLPQFANDPFVQSLRHFSSGFWMIFTGAGHVVDIKLFLAFWLIVTHASFLAAALHFARSLGYTDRRLLNTYTLLLSLAAPLIGTTVGGGGVMLEYFTHSELANASLILGFSLAIRRNYAAAAVATELTFFLNAFMAIWMVPPLLALAVWQIRIQSITFRRLLLQGLLGSLLGAILLVPPVYSVLTNHAIATQQNFSYRLFLRGYYPKHFFIDANSWLELLNLSAASVLCIAIPAKFARQMLAVQWLAAGAIALVAAGALVPIITDSAMVLNLHLIRSAVMIIMLSTCVITLLAASWLTNSGDCFAAFRGIIVATTVMTVSFGALIVLLLLALYRRENNADRRGVADIRGKIVATLSIAAGFMLALNLYATAWQQLQLSAVMSDWERMGIWTDNSLPLNAKFLIWRDPIYESPLGFQYSADRQLISDSKFGAAVMWSPTYFPIYAKDRTELKSVGAAGNKLNYAATAGADYLGADCSFAVTAPIFHRQGQACLYAVATP